MLLAKVNLRVCVCVCVCVCVFFFIFITIILFQLTCTLSNVAHNSPGIEFLKTISKFRETKFCHDF